MVDNKSDVVAHNESVCRNQRGVPALSFFQYSKTWRGERATELARYKLVNNEKKPNQLCNGVGFYDEPKSCEERGHVPSSTVLLRLSDRH